MANTIQVVLRDNVTKVGKAGDLVRVRPGFARNHLIPKGLAAVPSEGNVARIEHERRMALARAAKLRDKAEGVAQQLSQVRVEIPVRVGEEDRLFGSVTSRDVAAALKAHGHDIDRRKISLPDDMLKHLGEFDATVKLAPEVTATFKVAVTRKD